MTTLIQYSAAEEWAERIAASWRKSAESIIETGQLLQQAKDDLEHGQWLKMLEMIRFDDTKARRLMAIGRDERLSNQAILPVLPDQWTKIHKLSKLNGEAFERALVDPKSIKAEVRAAKEIALADKITTLPTKRYGVILADPEWRFEPYSRETGMDRAADNHYPTSEICDIAGRDVRSIAAPDCVLFLWATVPMLPQALYVMERWGFDYKSHIVWLKGKIGTGYWFRNAHELLLVGTCGNVPAPAPGTQVGSTIEAPAGEHSAKPDAALALIERYFPNLPKIELNRRGPTRPGWDAWGLEADTAGSVSVPVPDGATLIDQTNHHESTNGAAGLDDDLPQDSSVNEETPAPPRPAAPAFSSEGIPDFLRRTQ